ncbi:MAG: hypothetical protein AABW64_04440 [Nanoarchaeota archaeon]
MNNIFVGKKSILLWLFLLILFPVVVSALQQQFILITSDVAEDIWKSTNNGVNWTLMNSSFNAGAGEDPNVLALNSSGAVFIIDGDEDVWVSGNFGTSWTKIKDNFNNVNTDATAIIINNNTITTIDSSEDVWVSWNGGFSWTNTASNFNGANGDVGGLVAANNRTLITADNSEDVWRSTNGGVSWTLVNSSFNAGANQNPNAMAINSSDTVFIIDDDEDVWVSGNFGTSWRKIKDDFNSGNGGALAMYSDSNNTLYALDATEDVWVSWNGGFSWNLLADNLNGANGDVVGLVIFTNSTDVLPPTSTNIDSSPANNSNYSVTQLYFFNITLNDDVGIDDVIISFNNTNYSSKTGGMSNLSTVYTFNRTDLAAALYSYQWIFNDTSGNKNQTSTQSYTVQRASSSVNLTLDTSGGNLTILVGTSVNITALQTAGEGIIQLFNTGNLINNGNPLASNITLFSSLGAFNITAVYSATENFTDSFVTSYAINIDNVTPTVNAPPDAVYVLNSTQTIGWILTDNYAAGSYVVTRDAISVNASIWTNGTNLAIPINSSTLGLWNYTISYNDSVGNQGLSDSVLINISTNTSNVQPVVRMQAPQNSTFTRFSSALLQATVFDDNLDTLTAFFFGDDIIVNTTSNAANGTTVSYNWTNLSDSIHNWSVIASDTQMNSTRQYFFFTVDTIPPNVTLILPQNNSNFTSNISIPLNYSSSDLFLDKTWYSLDSGNNISLTQNTTFDTNYGSHTLVLSTNDSANNVQSTFAFFTVANTTNSSSGSGSGSSGGSGSSPGTTGNGLSTGDSGLGAFKDNPGVQAPRPQLHSSPSPPASGNPSSDQQVPQTNQQPSPRSTLPAVTGSAVGATLRKATNTIGKFLLGLAILAAILSILLRKKHPAERIISQEKRPMQFTVKKQQLSFLQQKAQHTFKSLQTAIRHVQEARKQRREYLNTRTSAKKMMVQPMDRLHRLEGLISEEFIADLRKHNEVTQQTIKPKEFKHYFPETNKELQEKGLEAPAIAADIRLQLPVQPLRAVAKEMPTTTTTELKKFFPETLGKSATFVAEKKIVLPHAKPRTISQLQKQDPTEETFVFKRVEKPAAETKPAPETNRKINKKTGKHDMLKRLEEVYDLA